MIFTHPTVIMRIHKKIVVMENCTSQLKIRRNGYLNTDGIEITNNKDTFFTIGENKERNLLFPIQPIKTSVVSSNKNTNQEEFVSNNPFKAQINQKLSSKMKQELIKVLYTYRNVFASDNELLGTIKRHEVNLTLNIARPYHPVLQRPAYPEISRASGALEKHKKYLIQLGVLRKLGQNKEAEVTTSVIIPWHNDKSRMVGNFSSLNT
ncbi:hypothetical protein O181_010952 [Austropuccinia psidii MF-1]|uniref:Uncharacterized protein n=1 Tax=Austropuccinia psidii MF-1 TaxID=1389203 RepID=A0A9Q3GLP3_9BASI|nr:hypothetical protein [Austropuccinia psidii MF-1]